MKKLFLVLFKKIVHTYYGKLYNYFIEFRSEYFTQKVVKEVKSGYGCRINGEITITHPESFILGNNVHIGDNGYFFSKGGIVIGDNTHLSRNVSVYSSSHRFNGNAVPYDHHHINKPVTIGKNVWIGMNVSIVPGITIEEGAIIGMGAVVTSNVKRNQIVGNQPLRTLKERDNDIYVKNLQQGHYGGISGKQLEAEEVKLFKQTGELKKDKLFFVVSTGRSGSQAIAKILNQHQDIKCQHEPHFQLIRLSTEYAHGLKAEQDVIEELEALYNVAGYILSDKFYGESDQKIGNLISLYHRVLPDAKFIWLVRDPIKAVMSMYSRGWFNDNEFGIQRNLESPVIQSSKIFSEFRLNGILCNEFDEVEWKNMHPFERCCWYWFYWNKNIEKQLTQIDRQRWCIVGLEQLDQDLIRVNRLLNIQNYEYQIKTSNSAYYEVENYENMDDKFKEAMNRWCKPYWSYLKQNYEI
ncbi:MAG: sulfotransferase [Bacteroidota bacterium]